jgi:hypothetical protein
MRYAIWAAIGAGLILLAFAGLPAHAADLVCVATKDGLDVAAKLGQRPLEGGALSAGGAALLTADPDTGKWTFWVAPRPGVLCPLVDGTGWKQAVNATPS